MSEHEHTEPAPDERDSEDDLDAGLDAEAATTASPPTFGEEAAEDEP